MSIKNKANQINFNFDNTYAKLPKNFYAEILPTPVQKPKAIIVNDQLASELGINNISPKDFTSIFSGNHLPQGSKAIAQAYAGHQFGHFTILGDGRAHLIGEHITPKQERFDIQLKGSGKTPYSRGGDGRATLSAMLREYIISEAMHSLRIPTTRSLAVISTEEPVYREKVLQGAILTRIAKSHIRIGTFEYMAADLHSLKILADYTIKRHYPYLKDSDQPYLDFIQVVINKQIELVINWLRVGFIHGVMNTDNTTISGETIDYGPCAFMETYDPTTKFSSIDHMGRYSYRNQAYIIQWNLSRLIVTLLPLLNEKLQKAQSMAEKILQDCEIKMQKEWLTMMRCKLGLFNEEKEDKKLIGDLLNWMHKSQADYTNTFCDLNSETMPKDTYYDNENFKSWWVTWQKRISRNNQSIEHSFQLMKENNPTIIPRNQIVEEALLEANSHNLDKVHKLLSAVSKPYEENAEYAYYKKPSNFKYPYQTFCGT